MKRTTKQNLLILAIIIVVVAGVVLFIKMLQAMLDALKTHMELSHKQNKISYEIDLNDGYKIKKF